MSKQNPKAVATASAVQATLPGAEQSAPDQDRVAAEQAEAARVAAEQAEAARVAAEQAEAARVAAEQAEAARVAAEQAEATVLMLRRDAIDGTWYPAGAVLHGVPRPLVQALKGDGCVDDDETSVAIALQAGAVRIAYVPPAASEVQADA